ASISPASLKRQEEVLPMAKLEQRRYKRKMRLTGQKNDLSAAFGYTGIFWLVWLSVFWTLPIRIRRQP
ncbi:MAG: hypothetical protein IIY91_04945, partial [Selenomonas sp.]|nr:hypothetical protein [Selenomonas sp.]